MESVQRILMKDAEEFCKMFHYLGGGLKFGICYGLIKNNQLAGVAVFSKIFEKKEYELVRFCLAPGAPKNTASRFLSICLKKISDYTDLVITYADEDVDHLGVLYQALSAFYLGKVAEGISYSINGKLYSGRFVESKVRAYLNNKEKVDVVSSKGKHKYVFVVSKNKKIKGALRKKYSDLCVVFPGKNKKNI